MEHLIIPVPRFDVKAAAGAGVATITGTANAYGVLDGHNDITQPGAAAKDLRERGNRRPLLQFHEMKMMPVGEVELRETARGLQVTQATLVLEVQAAREMLALLRNAPAALGGFSIGYIAEKERFQGGARLLEEISIWEVSIVVVPANAASTIDPVKGDPAAALRRIAAEMRSTLAGAAPSDDLRAVRDAFRRMKLTI